MWLPGLGEVAILFLLIIVMAILSLPILALAVWQDKRLHKRNPAALGFKWGYFSGFGLLFLGLVQILVLPELFRYRKGIEDSVFLEDYISSLIISLSVLFVCGIFILRRHRWPWIVFTVCTLNPFLWIINGIYIKNRWKEMKLESRDSSESNSLSSSLDTTTSQVAKTHTQCQVSPSVTCRTVLTTTSQAAITQTVNVYKESIKAEKKTPLRQDYLVETVNACDLYTLQSKLLTKLQSNVVKDIHERNSYEGALAFLEKRVENKTRNSHADLAHMLIYLKRHNEAIKICKEGLEVASNKSDLYQLIGIAYTMVGLPTQATDALSKALDSEPVNAEAKALIRALALKYPQGTANITTVAECREYLKKNPCDPTAHRRLADAYLSNENFEEATHAYEMALQIDPTDGLSHLGLGMLHMSSNRYGDAIVCLTNANRHAPTNPDTYYYLGLSYLKDGQRAMALRQYEVLIHMNEDKATSLFDAIYPNVGD